MKRLIVLACFGLVGCTSVNYECNNATPYVKFGASYKQYENPMYKVDSNQNRVRQNVSPIGGRFETGIDCGSYRVGYYHSSDIFTGQPFNNNGELERVKDEFFIDYIYKFEPLN